MTIEQILSKRQYARKLYFLDIVHEWEDVVAKELGVRLVGDLSPMPKVSTILNRILPFAWTFFRPSKLSLSFVLESGWHTQTHFPLMQLSPDDQRKELTSGDLFKGEVMAYPYGCPGSIDTHTAKHAEEVGLPCACAACNDVSNWTGRYLLPRMYVGGDKYAIHFELSGTKFFLKQRRLMPRIR